MPFGVQSSGPGVRPPTSGGSNLDAVQTEAPQNSITEDPFDLSFQNNSNLNNKESPKKISLVTFIVWPLIILVFIAIFVFLKRKLEE